MFHLNIVEFKRYIKAKGTGQVIPVSSEHSGI